MAGKKSGIRLLPGGLALWQVPGFRCGASYAGLKRPGKGVLDMAVLWAPRGASAAAVFTVNQAAAAPVRWSRRVIEAGRASALVVNSGNANACTGAPGARSAARMATLTALGLGLAKERVLVASTGIIGRQLDMARVHEGIRLAVRQAAADGQGRLERAIMTTDLVEKRAACRVKIGSRQATIAGVAKGSGMIAPHVATMLVFIATDAAVEPRALSAALREAADRTFNCLTVDGQGSTNDSVFLLASGVSGAAVRKASGGEFGRFRAGLEAVCRDLARQIARDGEGATKLVTVSVERARNDGEARLAARAVAESLLVKTALFGCDPNWGRILSAAGMSGARLDPGWARVEVGGLAVYDRTPLEFDVEAARRRLAAKEVAINLDLRQGRGSATVWTCDLSYDYVKINAEYHT